MPLTADDARELRRARWMILGAALTFSTGGAVIKATTLPPLQVASLRSVVAVVAMLAIMPEARRGWHVRTLPVSVAYAAMMLSFVTANKLTTAANAIFLQSTFPLWIVLLGPWLLGERVRRRDLGALAIMAVGAGLLSTGEDAATAVATDPALGNVVAAAAGLFWGLTLLGLRWLARDGAGSAVAASTSGALLAAVIAFALGGLPASLTTTDVVALLWLGVVQIGVSYVLMSKAMRRLDAMEATLWLLLEPAISPVWAWLAHGETLSATSFAGGGLILGALALRAVTSGGSTGDVEIGPGPPAHGGRMRRLVLTGIVIAVALWFLWPSGQDVPDDTARVRATASGSPSARPASDPPSSEAGWTSKQLGEAAGRAVTARVAQTRERLAAAVAAAPRADRPAVHDAIEAAIAQMTAAERHAGDDPIAAYDAVSEAERQLAERLRGTLGEAAGPVLETLRGPDDDDGAWGIPVDELGWESDPPR